MSISKNTSEALERAVKSFYSENINSAKALKSARRALEGEKNLTEEDLQKSLGHAAMCGNDALVNMLLDLGANINGLGGKYEHPPLVEAAHEGHVSTVKLLLARGANSNEAGGSSGYTALMAVTEAHDNGSDSFLVGKDKEAEHLEIIDILLKRNDIDIHKTDSNGRTAPMIAARMGDLAVMEKFIDRIDVNKCNNVQGVTLLMIASGWEDMFTAHSPNRGKLVKLLLDKGANPEAVDTEKGRTALMYALAGGYYEAAKVLIRHGANMHHKDNNGVKAFSIGGDTEVLETMLECGLPVDQVDQYGDTLLMSAASGANFERVELLLAKGADIHKATSRNHTLLEYAALSYPSLYSNEDTLSYPRFGSSENVFPERYDRYRAKIIVDLMARGAKVGSDPEILLKAAERGRSEVVRVLLRDNDAIDSSSDLSSLVERYGRTVVGEVIIDCAKSVIQREKEESGMRMRKRYGIKGSQKEKKPVSKTRFRKHAVSKNGLSGIRVLAMQALAK